jgi:hypothetical protein
MQTIVYPIYPIKQPNGKWGIWMIDRLKPWNLDESEAYSVLMQYWWHFSFFPEPDYEQAQTIVLDLMKACDTTGRAGEGMMDWNECVEALRAIEHPAAEVVAKNGQ